MAQTTEVLRLERHFNADPHTVFDAWINPAVLRRWWAIGPDWSTPVVEVDARPGGRYRLTMQSPDGERHTVGGEYRDVDPPTLLVYTWAWELDAGESGPESTVTVRFDPDAEGTRVCVEHAGLPDEESRGRHEAGWTGCLAHLSSVLAQHD